MILDCFYWCFSFILYHNKSIINHNQTTIWEISCNVSTRLKQIQVIRWIKIVSRALHHGVYCILTSRERSHIPSRTFESMIFLFTKGGI